VPRIRSLDPALSPLHFYGAELRRAREAAGMTLAEFGALVPHAARHLLEAMMTTSEYEKTFVEKIHDQGIAEGKAEAVLKLLDARHLAPSTERWQQVASCTDAEQLDVWFDRAITAGTAAEVFAD
jgi:hypothetical protein